MPTPPLIGQLQYFLSPVDGRMHPYAVCATDTSPRPKPLLLQVNPGALGNLEAAVRLTEEIATTAARHGKSCVVLRPTGRGPGTLYENYGEVDLFEAIEHVASQYVIDRGRISVMGASMGGAAVWYLITHYPDFFAAGAPWCGYCDYRLWEKPGGSTFHMHGWEEPSWRSRSAAFLVENLATTPVWMVHGAWDRGVGGGVSVEHSRQMARRMTERGYPHKYTEIPKAGHDSGFPKIWEELIVWLLDQRKAIPRGRVELATYGLRHNRSSWAAIEQLERYGERGEIDARRGKGGVVVATTNVRTFTLGPFEDAKGRAASRLKASSIRVAIDGQPPITFKGPRATFVRDVGGRWRPGRVPLAGQKRHGASGPISDLFHESLILVPGTTGSEEEMFFNQWIARNALNYFQSRNGGVHRGGIPGENTVHLPTVLDADLSDAQMRSSNLLLYGTHATNGVLAKLGKRIPITFERDALTLHGHRYEGEAIAAFAVFEHPLNRDRYVAVHAGATPDAACWGSHLDMMLLPDYMVYAKGKLIDWGFCDSRWRIPRGPGR